MLALSCLTAVVAFVVRHRETAPVTVDAAQARFDRLRAQFAGQSPLLDMQARSVYSPNTTASPRPLHTFHTVIFDRRGGDRLVDISLPYWLGRQYARHHGSFAWLGEPPFLDDTEFDPAPLQPSINVLE